MARIRSIKPVHWNDKELAKISLQAHLLWIATWNFSDDDGVFEGDPLLIKSQIFPRRTDIRVEQIIQWLDQLVKARFLIPFQFKGEGYYISRTFKTHQRIDKPQPGTIPVDTLDAILKEDILFVEHSTNVPRIVLPVLEGKGVDKEGNGREDARAAPNINFSVFWDLYDKKVGEKEKLEKKWLSLTDTEREKAIQQIPKYKLSQPEKKFRKNPETYLNNKSFNDEIINDVSSTIRSSKVLEPAGDREREDF